MNYDFDTLVDRSGLEDLKAARTPDTVKEHGIMSFWGAEFEFPCAPFVVDAVTEWAKKGLYCYTTPGKEFWERTVWWMKHHRNWDIKSEEIVPVYGITSSLATAMRAFTKPGSGIIGFTPGYHMYWEAIELSDRNKVASELIFDGEDYKIDWEDFEKKMADKNNSMLVFCNPHNPLGKVFHSEDLKRIAELAVKYDVIIYNDEIFAECLYKGVEFKTFAQAYPNHELKILTATSLGKWMGYTGMNQANLIIPNEELRKNFIAERNREFYGSFPPMMVPSYLSAYTVEGEEWLGQMMAYVEKNYNVVKDYFAENLPSFRVIKPEGTTIIWVDATEFCREHGFNEEKLMDFFINKAYFYVDRGTQYSGQEGFFRMTLSIPTKAIVGALDSLRKAVKNL